MTGDIDPKRLRLTEEGRKLLDTGIRDCPYCHAAPLVQIQKGTGRYRIWCNSRPTPNQLYHPPCAGMYVRAKSMERAVEKWNRKVDRRVRWDERMSGWLDRYDWERVK